MRVCWITCVAEYLYAEAVPAFLRSRRWLRRFQLPSALGKANSINGITSALDQPEFSAAIGLAKFGSLQHKRRRAGGFLFNRLRSLSDMFRIERL